MDNELISVIVNGAQGRMGKLTVAAIKADPKLKLIAALGRNDDLIKTITDTHAQVVVDFTNADSAFNNAKTIITANAHPVIGTSGLLPPQIEILKNMCTQKKLGGIVAPNFSIGTVLMMKLAQKAAKYFPYAEIIEMHHTQKKDAPSGTAVKTAAMIAEHRKEHAPLPKCTETIAGARGASHHHIPIHSVRLPGLVAHQEVIFGDEHELLTIRHDSFDRAVFMPGVLVAIKKVVDLKELIYGLEHFI